MPDLSIITTSDAVQVVFSTAAVAGNGPTSAYIPC